MVEYERLSDGSTVNVWFELETDGDEDIRTQELKLSEDTCNDPEQVVFDVLVVTEVVPIDSEKVTEMLSLTETELWLSLGDVEITEGGVVPVLVGEEHSPSQFTMIGCRYAFSTSSMVTVVEPTCPSAQVPALFTPPSQMVTCRIPLSVSS